MCSPAQLIRKTDDELLELANAALADLQRRHRPTPANVHVLAGIRATLDALRNLELYRNAALTAGPPPPAKVIDTAGRELPAFLSRQVEPGPAA